MKGLWFGFLAGGLLSVFSEMGVQLALALLLSAMVNSAVAGDSALLLGSVLRYGTLIAVAAAMLPPARRLCARAAETAGRRWREAAFYRLQGTSLSFLTRHPAQDIVSRLTSDVAVAVQFLGEELVDFAAQVVSAAVAASMIALIDLRFVALPMSVVGVVWLVNRCAARPLHDLSSRAQASLARAGSGLSELVQGQVAARAAGFGHVLAARFGNTNDEYRTANIRHLRVQSAVTAINNFLGAMNFLGIAAMGSFLLLRQEITAGEVAAIVQLSQIVVRPFRSAGGFWATLQQARAASARVFALHDAPAEELPREKCAANSDTAVTFDSVSFAYADDASLALDGVTFSIEKGATVAFVGESGGGKSTIFRLLLGLHGATSGAIAVNGRAIGDYTLEELRDVFALVPQEATLFSGTIYDNITCGRVDVDEADVLRAARAAHADDFISELALNYRSEVGERGGNLSGGQRQRIAIARALLKNAPILLLDEATASIDNESESLVWSALETLMAGRTTLLIAHRLSTAQKADLIFVLAGGKIVEQGTHSALLQQGGHYARLHAAAS
jgi:ABC-type multidrug transport system fused ATPase/permease subunit